MGLQCREYKNITEFFGAHTGAPAPSSTALGEQPAVVSPVRWNPVSGKVRQHGETPPGLCTASHIQKQSFLMVC